MRVEIDPKMAAILNRERAQQMARDMAYCDFVMSAGKAALGGDDDAAQSLYDSLPPHKQAMIREVRGTA